MPSISQQDYIIIRIEDTAEVTDAEKAEIAKYIDNGTILDALIESGTGSDSWKARIIGYKSGAISVYSFDDAEVISIPIR